MSRAANTIHVRSHIHTGQEHRVTESQSDGVEEERKEKTEGRSTRGGPRWSGYAQWLVTDELLV